MGPLNWKFYGEGEWEAESRAKEGLTWRAQVRDDGTFDISRSDHGLTNRKEMFQYLRNAKRFCETEESVFADGLALCDSCNGEGTPMGCGECGL